VGEPRKPDDLRQVRAVPSVRTPIALSNTDSPEVPTPFVICADSNAPEHKAEARSRGGSTTRASELLGYVLSALNHGTWSRCNGASDDLPVGLLFRCSDFGVQSGRNTRRPRWGSLIATVGAPCDAVDDRDIEATAKCFYQLKSAVGTYRFLASAVQKERQGWNGRLVLDRANILGRAGNYLPARQRSWDKSEGRDQLRTGIDLRSFRESRTGCSSSTWTQTWVQEQGRWRYMVQPKLEDIAAAQWKAGDYQAAAESFAKLLAKDPFSVFAYTGQLTALANRGARLPGRGVQDLVRGTLGVNSEDSRALAAAADATSDFQVAEMFIRKLAPRTVPIPGPCSTSPLRLSNNRNLVSLLAFSMATSRSTRIPSLHCCALGRSLI